MPADVLITEYTDPACPWAFSAEPFRLRLDWLYGDHIDWQPRMVGLSDGSGPSPFTPEMLSNAYKKIAHDHRMPIDTGVRERIAASVPACRAVVAVRLNGTYEQARALLRNLRVRTMSGELLDATETLDGAARDAGVDPADLARWVEDPATQAALDEDMAAARAPIAAARVLDARLADWSGGRRYTCPSYELQRADGAGEKLAAPGFQPFAVYDVLLANLVPGVERRPLPETVEEVLQWAGMPLASIEVATIMDVGFEDARERLGRVAVEQPVGADGYWTLPA